MARGRDASGWRGGGRSWCGAPGGRPSPLWSTQANARSSGRASGGACRLLRRRGRHRHRQHLFAIHHDRLAPDGLDPYCSAPCTRPPWPRCGPRGRRMGGAGSGRNRPAGRQLSPRPAPRPRHRRAALRRKIVGILAPACDLIRVRKASPRWPMPAPRLTQRRGRTGPVWLSVTLDDEDGTRLRSGEPVAGVLPILAVGGAAAVLANCSAPEAMPAALDIFARAGLPFGAYAKTASPRSPRRSWNSDRRPMPCRHGATWGPRSTPITSWAGSGRARPHCRRVLRDRAGAYRPRSPAACARPGCTIEEFD